MLAETMNDCVQDGDILCDDDGLEMMACVTSQFENCCEIPGYFNSVVSLAYIPGQQ